MRLKTNTRINPKCPTFPVCARQNSFFGPTSVVDRAKANPHYRHEITDTPTQPTLTLQTDSLSLGHPNTWPSIERLAKETRHLFKSRDCLVQWGTRIESKDQPPYRTNFMPSNVFFADYIHRNTPKRKKKEIGPQRFISPRARDAPYIHQEHYGFRVSLFFQDRTQKNMHISFDYSTGWQLAFSLLFAYSFCIFLSLNFFLNFCLFSSSSNRFISQYTGGGERKAIDLFSSSDIKECQEQE